MRIAVDFDLCQGHQVCMSEAPDVFSVPPDGQVRVLVESVGEERRTAVELAVKYCPTHALKIVED